MIERERCEQLRDGGGVGRVEVAGRLVGEDERGIVGESERDGDALLLAPAQFLRPLPPFGLEAHQIEQRLRACMALGFGDARHDHRQLEVLERGDARNEIEELKHEADAQQAMLFERALVHLREILSIDDDLSRRRPIDSAEQVEQRRLAAAARTHDRDRFAATNFPRALAQRVDLLRRHLIPLAHALDANVNAFMFEHYSILAGPHPRSADALAA